MLSGPDTIVLLVVALLVFGPKKLPEMGKSLGHTIKDLRDAMEGRGESPPPPPAEVARRDDVVRRDEVAVRPVEPPAEKAPETHPTSDSPRA